MAARNVSMRPMRPCTHVEIVTPKKFLLNGLWFGPRKPKRVIVWVHGLGGSVFSNLRIIDRLVDSSTAVVTFNNRGHDKVAKLPHSSGVYTRAIRAGAAHEKFTDCADDIKGVINLVRKQGVKNVYLAGHSTGCQKSVYFASKNKRGIKGVILLGPISDYDAFRLEYGDKRIARALRYARRKIQEKKGDELLPPSVWDPSWLADAQRLVSLCAGEGPEEIFTYWNEMTVPRALRHVSVPTLVLLADRDEFTNVPAEQLTKWFDANIRAPHSVVVVPRVGHSFKGGEGITAGAIRRFMKEF
jgi:pimeloyl-ACP methyl ester carboxylesterase